MAQEYKLISASNLLYLEGAVCKALSEGWQVQGSPFYDADERCWRQAATRITVNADSVDITNHSGKTVLLGKSHEITPSGEVRLQEPEKQPDKPRRHK